MCACRVTVACLVSLIVSPLFAAGVPSPSAIEAEQILQRTGVTGGLVVHLGCGDGRLVAALGEHQNLLVHGLDTSGDNVAAARKRVQDSGRYGVVSIDQQQGRALPYVDNLVNLFVISRQGNVPLEEVLRATAPGGTIYRQAGDQWTTTVKPWPDGIDQWTHYLYNASGNAVSQDRVVGPPRHFQWIAGPRWARSHDHLSSVSAMVSAGGRVFYIIDEAPAASVAFDSQWSLVARDAFNGVLLWKRPIKHWEGHLRDFRTGPTDLQRRLVAVGERVFVTLGYGEPVTALDAATGETVLSYPETDNALELIHHHGKLFVLVGDRLPDNTDGAAKPVRPQIVWHWWPIYEENQPAKHIVALDAKTASVIWTKHDQETARIMPTTLAASGPRLYFQNPDQIVALDADDGTIDWRVDRPVNRRRPTWSTPTLVVYGDVLLSADRSNTAPPPDMADSEKQDLWVVTSRGGQAPVGKLIAYDVRTGKEMWASDCREGYNSPVDVLVADSAVWSGNLVTRREPGITSARSLQTGEVVRQRPQDQEFFKIVMSHHRCYRNKATENYLITGRDGIEFIDTKTGEGFGNHWVRGSCQLGIMPSNGLVYASQHSCACHIESKLNSLNALAAKRATEQRSAMPSAPERLLRGPAYNAAGIPADSTNASWPTYRGNAARTGSTSAGMSAQLKPAWETSLTGGRLSSVVIAHGRLFVAEIDAHQVHALDADSGDRLWSFTAGGRVDSPPTIHAGTAIFGSADGWIYCITAADGQLVWRWRAAPYDARFVAYGQLESASPVPGSVLVHGDSIYAAVGRTTYLDDGMRLVQLNASTGELISETPISPSALPDVLSCDGQSIYLRHRRFDFDGVSQRTDVPHLYSPAGFLDDSWWHRTYWQFGTSMGSGWGAWPNSGQRVPAGRLMVTAGDDIYGFGRLDQYHRDGSHVGLGRTQYVMYACRRTEQPKSKATGKKAKTQAKQPATGYQYRWAKHLPLLGRAMVLCDDKLFVAGPPDLFVRAPEDITDPYHVESREALRKQKDALAGKYGGRLQVFSAEDGKLLAGYELDAPPAWDAMVPADGRLYLGTTNGAVVCMQAAK